MADEHVLQDDNRFIADIMYEFKQARGGRSGRRDSVAHALHRAVCTSSQLAPAGTATDVSRFLFASSNVQAKAKGGAASRLLFKKRMFRETDETITESQASSPASDSWCQPSVQTPGQSAGDLCSVHTCFYP